MLVLVLVPKQGKDWSKPISLLNVDNKIFVSVWVARLSSFIGEYIEQDLTDFLKQRYMKIV